MHTIRQQCRLSVCLFNLLLLNLHLLLFRIVCSGGVSPVLLLCNGVSELLCVSLSATYTVCLLDQVVFLSPTRPHTGGGGPPCLLADGSVPHFSPPTHAFIHFFASSRYN